MTDHGFEELMRTAGEWYRRPPQPPLEAMWQEVEATFQNSGAEAERAQADGSQRGRFSRTHWFLAAATLIVGVGIGRLSMSLTPSATQKPVALAPTSPQLAAAPAAGTRGPSALRTTTDAYFSQTAALLIALPAATRAERSAGGGTGLAQRANELLLTTRLLLDSPDGSDPALRNLLEDLELVLAQIARLPTERTHQDLEFINQTLDQREVLPRLHRVVADITTDDD